MCHTLLEIPKKRANINHRLLFMKVINVSLSALLLAARFGEAVRGPQCVCSLQHCVRTAPQTYEKSTLYLALTCSGSLLGFLSCCQKV